MGYYSIAIDGPSGAGKSTLAKKLAGDIGFIYVDTGAIYRTVGLYARRKNISCDEIHKVCEYFSDIKIGIKYDDTGLQHVYLNGEDVSEEIRLPEISTYASTASAVPQVRDFLLSLQRRFAEENNVIMDGRDIGTVVLPNADLKIYLSADVKERARRRYLELSAKNVDTDYDEVLEDIKKRDYRDMNRKTAPLKMADDAVLLDTTDYDLAKSFEVLRQIVKDKLKI